MFFSFSFPPFLSTLPRYRQRFPLQFRWNPPSSFSFSCSSTHFPEALPSLNVTCHMSPVNHASRAAFTSSLVSALVLLRFLVSWRQIKSETRSNLQGLADISGDKFDRSFLNNRLAETPSFRSEPSAPGSDNRAGAGDSSLFLSFVAALCATSSTSQVVKSQVYFF
jgi:hypothetical protein